MTYSLSEIQSLCIKAARGAGLEWGQAEDAGYGACFLAKHGLDDGRHYVSALHQFGHASALRKGPALCDVKREFDSPIQLEKIKNPLFMLPFISLALKGSSHTVSVTWGAFQFDLTEQDVSSLCPVPFPSPDRLAETMHIKRIADNKSLIPLPKKRRLIMDQDAIKELNSFAQRTYAPSTEVSRTTGAGAVLNDND